ncbi:hypothetical protein [Nannocystis sp. SCPEA4]|uniref:hypothetical protein n=1 Tax=Nannocystis sp. SCPEA4 TaxID=2996787 RepID=UPI00226EBFC7|nr:hypothetical protein [Nannocystis sp. SCPEA4]MCY1062126.1 hypothetical protein [Nannocystis sp. SCPEA4]
MLRARVIGRSDDGRFHVLQQETVGGPIFRWPARGEDAAGTAALITIRPASSTSSNPFEVLRAGSYLFLRTSHIEIPLFFDLLPALPPAVEVSLELLPAEVNEGVEPEPVAQGAAPQ